MALRHQRSNQNYLSQFITIYQNCHTSNIWICSKKLRSSIFEFEGGNDFLSKILTFSTI